MPQAPRSQPLQVPVSMPEVTVKTPGLVNAVNVALGAATLNSGSGVEGSSSSILDELEREADEMANRVVDQPLSMPESELQVSTAATGVLNATRGNKFVSAIPPPASPAMIASVRRDSFSAVPLSMPPEISASVATSAGLVQPDLTMASAAPVTTAAGANMYHGMSLTGSQIQQIHQIQQMQQLRQMQQLQQQVSSTGRGSHLM